MTSFKEAIQQKKIVLWDFDGCFCNSEHVHYKAYAMAFADVGHKINEKEYYDTFTHTGAGVAKEIATYGLSCDESFIRHQKAKYYRALIESKEAQLFPEIPQIVDVLLEKGIISVIASNSSKQDIDLILSQSPVPVALKGVFGLEASLRKKPWPDLFLKALSVMGYSSKDALVVEDSERGLQAAESAGCQALWIKTSLTSQFSTTAPYLDKISHQDLLTLLKGL